MNGAMFVFSRRAIQRCIDELGDVLSGGQLERLVKRLNLVGSGRFAASWEACLLHSLSRVGVVSHEASLPSRREPDVWFTYPGDNAPGFIADITAISDEGLRKANPVHDLSNELSRLALKLGSTQITFATMFAASTTALTAIKRQGSGCPRKQKFLTF